MKNREYSDLLKEVLEQGVSPDFQNALETQVLRAAKRRKQIRQLGQSALVTAVLLVTILTFLPFGPFSQTAHKRSLSIVHSSPLPPEMILKSLVSVPQVTSSKSTYALISSRRDSFVVLGDDELFKYLEGHPATLVRRGDGTSDLVFANPDDMKGFPLDRLTQ